MEGAQHYTLLTLFNSVLTVYTIQTAQTVTCMPMYTVTLLEWADALLSQKM